MKHTDATGSRASLNICLTYTKKESWSAPWGYPNTWIIIGVIGAVWSIHLSRLEHVGGCTVDGLPLITASTTRLPFIHVRSVGNQTAYSEDDHVNSVAPGTSSGWEEPWGTKADQEELQCHHPENHWKPMKTMENMGCPVSGGLCGFDNRCIPCSYWWTLSSVCSSTSLSKLLGFHAGWTRFAKHIVTT